MSNQSHVKIRITMFSLFLKSLIAFTISFVVLSFHIQKKPIFYHLTEIMGPLGTDIQKSIGKSVKRGMKKSSEIGQDFIQNNKPEYQDYVESKRSSGKLDHSKETVLEEIRKEEKRKLDELINSN